MPLVAARAWKWGLHDGCHILDNLAWAPVLHWDGRTPDGQCFVPEDTRQEVCLPPLESQAFKSLRTRQVYTGFLPKIKAIQAYRAMFEVEVAIPVIPGL